MDLPAAHNLATTLMLDHQIQAAGWRFRFDNAPRRFGYCDYRRKLISLSRPLILLNDEARVRNTILHEIAHVLVPGHNHDAIWRRKALEIGNDGLRCYEAEKVSRPAAPYQAACPNGHSWPIFRRPRRRIACRECCKVHTGGRFDPRFVVSYNRT